MFSIPPRSLWRSTLFLAPWCVLAGCQTYEPLPLDLDAYRVNLDTRALDPTPIANFDPNDGISCAEGEVLALFYNPELRLARAEAGVALATKETAGLWEDPIFGFDVADIVSPSGPFEFGLVGSFTIPISGRLGFEQDQADAAYDATLRSLINAEWQTRAALRMHWARWTAAVAKADIIAQSIKQLETIGIIAQRLEAAGELNRVERRLLTIELANRLIEASEIDLLVIETNTALLGVMGLPPSASDLLEPAFPDVTLPDLAHAEARLLESNTLLAFKRAEYKTAEETLRLEIQKQFPDIVLGPGYGKEGSDHKILFGVSIPVPMLNANRAAIAKATAIRDVVRTKAQTTTARLLLNLGEATEIHATRVAQRTDYETTIIPLLEEQEKDISRIADLGELDMFVLLETTDRTLKARARLLDLRVAELDAAITIFNLLGPNKGENQ